MGLRPDLRLCKDQRGLPLIRKDRIEMDKNMNDVLIKAETLIEALPYIRDFSDKRVIDRKSVV